MKIAVISDTHGFIEEIVSDLMHNAEVDKILHLGDFTKDAKKISNLTSKEVLVVKGNCDMLDKKNPLELCIEFEGCKILMVHGHEYNVKLGLTKLYYRAMEQGADLVLYGHSHILAIDKIDDILFLNPGSVTLPRSNNGKTYIYLDLEGGNINYQVKYLD